MNTSTFHVPKKCRLENGKRLPTPSLSSPPVLNIPVGGVYRRVPILRRSRIIQWSPQQQLPHHVVSLPLLTYVVPYVEARELSFSLVGTYVGTYLRNVLYVRESILNRFSIDSLFGGNNQPQELIINSTLFARTNTM